MLKYVLVILVCFGVLAVFRFGIDKENKDRGILNAK